MAAHDWLITFERPGDISDHEYALIIRYALGFFADDYVLWKRNTQGTHKRVPNQGQRVTVMIVAHNDVGHHSFYLTNALAAEHYWWPFMGQDIAWFIRTCHICQTHQTHQVAIPLVVATPAPLFAKMYMNTMHLPCSSGYFYIVQGHCPLTHYPEFCMLRKETAQVLGDIRKI